MAGDDQPPGPEGLTPEGTEPESAEPDPPPHASVRASRTFAGVRRSTLLRTGYSKPLSTAGKAGRLWSALGLMLGRRLAIVVRDDHFYLILMAAVVGVTSGAAAGLLLAWIENAIEIFPQPGEEKAFRWFVFLAVPVAGGLLVGALRLVATKFFRVTPVGGVAGVVEGIDRRAGHLDGRQGLLTGIGTGITMGTGGSVGHEGPSVAIGATVGSVVARFFGLRLRRQVAMVGAGCAAGIAAAFNAPLAGVIFTVELVFRGSIGGDVGSMSMFVPLIVAAVTGTFTSHAIFGERPEFHLPAHGAASLPDLGFYVALALIAAVMGVLINKFFIWVQARFESMKIPEWVKPAIGGLGVGIMAAILSNQLLGTGRATVASALQGNLVWQAAAILLVGKIVATALTRGSGGFGGVFFPALYTGACLGTLVGLLAELTLGPSSHGVGAYALVGMGAIFGAMMHAPLTPIVMIFEITKDYGIILPLMLSCILSVGIARKIGRDGFYLALLKHRKVVLSHEVEGDVMKRGRVRELMLPASRVLTMAANLDEVRSVCLGAELGSTFVVDADGSVIGYLDGTQLARRMLQGEIQEGSTAGDLMGRSKLTLLYPEDTLAGAMLAFARAGQDMLPVVDADRRLQGSIRRGDLIAHYSDEVLGRQEETVQVASGGARPDEEVGLGEGVVLERVVVGRRWAGKSLAELDLRGKLGVVVLEWRRGERVLPIDPRKPLREADVVAIAGTRDAILKARTL